MYRAHYIAKNKAFVFAIMFCLVREDYNANIAMDFKMAAAHWFKFRTSG